MKNKLKLQALVLTFILALISTGYSYAGSCPPPPNQPGTSCTTEGDSANCCDDAGTQFCTEKNGELTWGACTSL